MGYLAVWKILEEITVALRRRGVSVPEAVMNDLKAARTMIKITEADAGHGDTHQKIEEYLGTVEAHLITEAQKHFTIEQINSWLKRLEEANRQLDEEYVEQRFIAGVPRDKKWVRVEPQPILPIEKLKQLATEINLSTTQDDDGRIIVYGSDENLKEFIKKMAEITKQNQKTHC
ncbi:MAG: DUF2096 family protein [Candidatus Bathyarchaeia archaeon]